MASRDFAQEGGTLPESLERQLEVSAERIGGLLDPGDEDRGGRERALGLISLCVGAMVLARAVDDPSFSDELMRAAADYGCALPDQREEPDE